MANFYPFNLKKDDRADLLIFNQIKDYVKLYKSETVNWYIYNSLELNSQSHPTQEEGEMDFVLMIPNYGIIVIESKGHSDPGYNNGVWGKIKGNKNPFTQVRDNRRALRNYFYQSEPKYANLQFSYVVVFPYWDSNNIKSTEWSEWQLIDKDKFNSKNIIELIKQIINNDINNAEKKGKEKRKPDRTDMKNLNRIIYNYNEIKHDTYTSESQIEINTITNEHLDSFMDIFQENTTRKLLIDGAAGTGKTYAALNLAKLNAQENTNILFTCYNRNLSEWISNKLIKYKNIKTANIHSLFYEIINPYGNWGSLMADLKINYRDNKNRDGWDKLAVLATELFMEHELEQYDYLIIDESQDVLSEPILDFFDICLKNGLNNGRWAMFGDFKYQDIFINYQSITTKYEPQVIPFKSNLRNPKNIGIISESIITSKTNELYNKYKNPVEENPIEIIEYSEIVNGIPSDEDYINKFDKLLTKIESQNNASNTIIITQQIEGANKLAKIKKINKNISKKINKLTPEKIINRTQSKFYFTNTQSFKGLESPIIIFTEIEEFDDINKKLNYITFTRALNKIYIVIEKNKLNKLLDTKLLSKLDYI